jgi:hypothetical protein
LRGFRFLNSAGRRPALAEISAAGKFGKQNLLGVPGGLAVKIRPSNHCNVMNAAGKWI